MVWPTTVLVLPYGSASGSSLLLGKTNLSSLVPGEMPTAQQTRSSKLERQKKTHTHTKKTSGAQIVGNSVQISTKK